MQSSKGIVCPFLATRGRQRHPHERQHQHSACDRPLFVLWAHPRGNKSRKAYLPGHTFPSELAKACSTNSLSTFTSRRPLSSPSSLVRFLLQVSKLFDKHRLESTHLRDLLPILGAAIQEHVASADRTQLLRITQNLCKLQLVPAEPLWRQIMQRAETVYGAGAARAGRYDGSWVHFVMVMRMLSSGASEARWSTHEEEHLTFHDIDSMEQACGSRCAWPPPAAYLRLPTPVIAAAEATWARYHSNTHTVDGPWHDVSPLQAAKAQRHASPFERSVSALLTDMLVAPVVHEAVLGGTCVPVDLAVISRGGGGRRCEAGVYVAVEVQGPHHFVSRREVRETRSSRAKRLLREFLGWHVVLVEWKEWSRWKEEQRRNVLHERLSGLLPHRAWRSHVSSPTPLR